MPENRPRRPARRARSTGATWILACGIGALGGGTLAGCKTSDAQRVVTAPQQEVIAPPAEEVEPRRKPSSEAYRAVLQAELLIEAGANDEALRFLQEALLYDPGSAWLHLRIGEIQLSAGRLDDAQQAAVAALERAPDALDAIRLLAVVSVLQGEQGRAQRVLRAGLDKHPGDRPLSTLLAELYLAQDRVREAEQVIDGWMAREPAAIDGFLTLARLFAERGEIPAALTYVRRALDRDPRSVDTLALQQNLLWSMGAFDEARQTIERLFTERGDSFALREDLLVTLLLAGHTEEALRLSTAWLEQDPAPQMVMELARAWERAGDLEQAQRWFERISPDIRTAQLALELGRIAFVRHDDVNVISSLCPIGATELGDELLEYSRALCIRSLARSGQAPKSDEIFAAVISQHATSWRLWSARLEAMAESTPARAPDADFMNALAEARAQAREDRDLLDVAVLAFERAGRPMEGKALLDEMLRIHGEEPQLLLMTARFWERQHERRAAIALGDRLLRRGTPSVDLLNFMAFTLAEQRIRLDEAQRFAWRAVFQDPLNGYIVDTLGWTQRQQGHLDEAWATLQRANQLSPGEAEILFHLADTAYALGRVDDARQLLEEATERGLPSDPVLERVRSLQQRLESR